MRDYLKDMNDLINDRLPLGTDYIAGVESAKLVEWLRENDPDLLYGWLSEVAVPTLTRFISTRSNRDRSNRRRHARAYAFSAAASAFAVSGDPSEFSPFLEEFVVNEDNLRRIVANMTSGDHTFVATKYDQRAKQQKMEAAFHNEIARMIGPGQTTSDVMDEARYQFLHDSITSGAI